MITYIFESKHNLIESMFFNKITKIDPRIDSCEYSRIHINYFISLEMKYQSNG